MDFSSPDTWRWAWLVVAVGCSVGEIAVAGTFFLLPFAVGAAVAAIAAFAGVPVAWEWAMFLVASGLSSAVLWPLGRRLEMRSPRLEVGANRWEGREGYVLKDIPRGPAGTGLVRIDREEWRAESLTGMPIRAGSTVLVSRVDGTRLIVVTLEEPASDVALGPGQAET